MKFPWILEDVPKLFRKVSVPIFNGILILLAIAIAVKTFAGIYDLVTI